MTNKQSIASIAVAFSLIASVGSAVQAQTICFDLGVMVNCADSYGNSATGLDLGGGITTWNGNNGNSGTMMDLGGGIATWNDSYGNSGTGIDLGGGMWSFSDNRGNSLTCLDLGGGIVSCN